MNPTDANRCDSLTRLIIQARALGATHAVARLEARRLAIIDAYLAERHSL